MNEQWLNKAVELDKRLYKASAALKQYGVHDKMCQRNLAAAGSRHDFCTCGFELAIANAEAR